MILGEETRLNANAWRHYFKEKTFKENKTSRQTGDLCCPNH